MFKIISSLFILQWSCISLAANNPVRFAVEANVNSIEIFLTMDAEDEALNANALNLFKTIKAPNLPVPDDAIKVIGRNPKTGESSNDIGRILRAIEDDRNMSPDLKQQYRRLLLPHTQAKDENLWKEDIVPQLRTFGNRPYLVYSNGKKVEVNPRALHAIWSVLPDLAYAEINGRMYLPINSCANLTPALSMLSLIGVQVNQKNFNSIGLSKPSFDKWMQLYLTIGNAWEMGYTSCNRPMYYLHRMWPNMTGANWRAGMTMLSSSREEQNTLYLTWLPQWRTNLNFSRHGYDSQYWNIGIRRARLESESNGVGGFFNSLLGGNN